VVGDTEVFQRWVDESRMPTPSGRIKLDLRGCVFLEAAVSCSTPNRVIGFAPQDHDSRSIFLHEMGHQVDFQMAKKWHRRAYRRMTGCLNAWRARNGGPGCEELWATSWALCAQYKILPETYETQYEFRPSEAIHEESCRLFRKL
jgi:hypothetical protein